MFIIIFVVVLVFVLLRLWGRNPTDPLKFDVLFSSVCSQQALFLSSVSLREGADFLLAGPGPSS